MQDDQNQTPAADQGGMQTPPAGDQGGAMPTPPTGGDQGGSSMPTPAPEQPETPGMGGDMPMPGADQGQGNGDQGGAMPTPPATETPTGDQGGQTGGTGM